MSSFSPPSSSSMSRLRVGYALSPDKMESFVQPSLVAYARDHGIDLLPIDPQVPLLSQGPFHCVLHKLNSPDWISQLLHLLSLNPNLPVVDPPHAIQPLRNRLSMLQVVNRLNLDPSSLGIPKQLLVDDFDQQSLPLAEFEFPLIAKSVVADGSSASHQMSLVFNPDGFRDLKAPVVLQEFVNHGGVIFKVYVAGRHVRCVKRTSLPDVSAEQLGQSKSILSFSQISNLANKDRECSDEVTARVEGAELPPMGFVMDVSRGLRSAMGLRLFNFDMIRDSRDGDRYLIIDINYFPGYAKVPGFEKMLTDFLLDVINGEQNQEKKDDTAGLYDKDGGTD